MSYNIIADFLKHYGFKTIAEAKLNSNELKFINQHHHLVGVVVDKILKQQNIMLKSVIINAPTSVDKDLATDIRKATTPQVIELEIPKEVQKARLVVSAKDELTFNEWMSQPKIIDSDKPLRIKIKYSDKKVIKLNKGDKIPENLTPLTKICNECKMSKSLDEFYDLKSGKYGKDGKCIPCRKDYLKEYNRKKKELPY